MKTQVETVLDVHHWNNKLFSFKTTRDKSLRFRNGEFVMLGLPCENKPVMRAYSIASPNYEEHLEFLSIKVPDGKLTSKLQKIEAGSQIIVSKKPTGTLVIDDLNPGRNLYLLSTGTGLAPFFSIIQDPATYERFEKVILCHSVRTVDELCYQEAIQDLLPQHEFLGEFVRDKLIYFPTVTREPFENEGRLTKHFEAGSIFEKCQLPALDAKLDRAMICGNSSFLADMSKVLTDNGLTVSPRSGVMGDFVIERAFVD